MTIPSATARTPAPWQLRIAALFCGLAGAGLTFLGVAGIALSSGNGCYSSAYLARAYDVLGWLALPSGFTLPVAATLSFAVVVPAAHSPPARLLRYAGVPPFLTGVFALTAGLLLEGLGTLIGIAGLILPGGLLIMAAGTMLLVRQRRHPPAAPPVGAARCPAQARRQEPVAGDRTTTLQATSS